MCGLAGFAGRGDRTDLERMTDALAHRGPDGSGYHVENEARVFLGHRRLAVVDILTGQQPMWNEDGQVAVVFNGEIYNHSELRDELTRCGHRFASHHSDTEVLVHGWEEWGEDLPLRLNGMFAFAVYDRRQACFFLARDRFGEKPLYYASLPGFFAFASELTALATHRQIARNVDVRSVQKLFAYGYIPAPNAFYEKTHKLPGGHWLRYDVRAEHLEVSSYWEFALDPDESLTDADEPELVDELSALLVQAARRRLMSDVPLGVFLSGGIDSSLVLAALATEQPGSSFETFTIGFREPTFDESPFARLVADHIGSRHNERILGIERARDLIPQVLASLDEPLGDPSILPTSVLCSFASEKVTVALSGDGGDELFAGYDPFLAVGPAEVYQKLISPSIHKKVRRLADLLPLSDANMSLEFRLKRGLMGLSYPESARLPIWMSPLEPSDLRDLFEMPIRVEDVYSEAIALWEASPSRDPIDRTLQFFTRFYLQDDILMKVDRAAMAHSLETRAVFLDNDLVDFCMRLPNRFKFRRGQRKYLLKKVARHILPRIIVDRKKKGFGIPLAKWLRDLPSSRPEASIPGINAAFVRQAWYDHRTRRLDRRYFLWAWLSLESTKRSRNALVGARV